MSPKIQILYEDKLSAGNPKNYGPHLLVLACLADRLDRTRWSFTCLTPYACKGIGRFILKCGEPGLLDAYVRVVALCDDDEVRPHLRLPASACKTQVTAALRSRAGSSPLLHPVLLAPNLEGITDVVAELLGQPPPGKPTPLERDRLLEHFVHRSQREQRRELLRRVPSFGYLVERLAGIVAELGL